MDPASLKDLWTEVRTLKVQLKEEKGKRRKLKSQLDITLRRIQRLEGNLHSRDRQPWHSTPLYVEGRRLKQKRGGPSLTENSEIPPRRKAKYDTKDDPEVKGTTPIDYTGGSATFETAPDSTPSPPSQPVALPGIEQPAITTNPRAPVAVNRRVSKRRSKSTSQSPLPLNIKDSFRSLRNVTGKVEPGTSFFEELNKVREIALTHLDDWQPLRQDIRQKRGALISEMCSIEPIHHFTKTNSQTMSRSYSPWYAIVQKVFPETPEKELKLVKYFTIAIKARTNYLSPLVEILIEKHQQFCSQCQGQTGTQAST